MNPRTVAADARTALHPPRPLRVPRHVLYMATELEGFETFCSTDCRHECDPFIIFIDTLLMCVPCSDISVARMLWIITSLTRACSSENAIRVDKVGVPFREVELVGSGLCAQDAAIHQCWKQFRRPTPHGARHSLFMSLKPPPNGVFARVPTKIHPL